MLERIDGAALVLDARGRIITSNSIANAIIRSRTLLRQKSDGELEFMQPASDGAYRLAVAGAINPAALHSPAVFKIHDVAFPRGGIVVVLPLRSRSSSITISSAEPRVLVVIRSADSKVLPPAQLLQTMYRLTAAEAAVAMELARGATRTKLQIEGKKRDLALFNLAIDSKLRGCDVVAVRVDDVAPSGYSMDRATIRQKKTGRPVRFELTDQTRMAIDEYLRLTGRKPGQFLFAGRKDDAKRGLTTRQYARLVQEWVASIGLDPAKFGTHSLRRTKAVLIYRQTGNLRTVQLLLGHSKIESTVRYLGIEVDDAIEIAEKIDI